MANLPTRNDFFEAVETSIRVINVGIEHDDHYVLGHGPTLGRDACVQLYIPNETALRPFRDLVQNYLRRQGFTADVSYEQLFEDCREMIAIICEVK